MPRVVWVAVLIYSMGFPEPQFTIITAPYPLLVFLWNKGKILVKVEELICRKCSSEHSAIIGSE